MGRIHADWVPYCGAAPAPDDLLVRWNLDPVLIAIGAATLLLAWRFPRLRTSRNGAILALIALLYVSPFCALGSALFSARVVHHLALTLVLAPLIAGWFAQMRWTARASLAILTAVQAAVFWAWHSPVLYELALSNDPVFWAMQITIAGSAAAWWAVLRRASAGSAVLALLATMVQMGLLGALLTFAGRAFYAPHWFSTAGWGLSPLEDQQVAGLIMWAPGSAAYLLIAMALLYRSLGPARPPLLRA